VVTLDAYAQRTLLLDPTFQQDYQLVRSYPADVWLSKELLVFRRAATAPAETRATTSPHKGGSD
jgi:hypothetical protein